MHNVTEVLNTGRGASGRVMCGYEVDAAVVVAVFLEGVLKATCLCTVCLV